MTLPVVGGTNAGQTRDPRTIRSDLLGFAIALNDVYPRWLGWIAAFAGLGSVAAGLVQAFTGEPTVAPLVLTIIGPTIISLWVLVMGMLMGRRAPRA